MDETAGLIYITNDRDIWRPEANDTDLKMKLWITLLMPSLYINSLDSIK